MAPIIRESLTDFIKGSVTIATGQKKKSSLKLQETGGRKKGDRKMFSSYDEKRPTKLASTKTCHCICVRCGGSRLCLAF